MGRTRYVNKAEFHPTSDRRDFSTPGFSAEDGRFVKFEAVPTNKSILLKKGRDLLEEAIELQIAYRDRRDESLGSIVIVRVDISADELLNI